MISRVTDDYQPWPMRWCGGSERLLGGLTAAQPKGFAIFSPPDRSRAEAGRPVRHPPLQVGLCINAKEAENVELFREVIALIPSTVPIAPMCWYRRDRPQQEHPKRGIIFQEHVDLAMKTNELILIHTPTWR